jgi:hypothetical protein
VTKINIYFIAEESYMYNFFCFTDGLILTNGLAMIFRILEFNDDLQESALAFSGSWDMIVFVSCELEIYTLRLEHKLYFVILKANSLS